MQIKKIGIIGGTNGLGKRFATFFEEKFSEMEILVSGRKTNITNKKIVQECDLVIFAIPISETEKVIEENIENSHENQILIDFTSVKIQPMETLSKTKAEYCGMHPIFGPLKDIKNQKIVICPGRISPKNLNTLKKIFEDFELMECTAEEHDKIMGVVQCLSHFSDFVLGKALKDLNINFDQVLQFSSPPYRIKLDLLARMFAQNPNLYAEISTYNKYGKEFQHKFIESAEIFGKWLDEKESTKIAKEFENVEHFLGKTFCETAWDKSQKFLAFESFITENKKKRVFLDEVILDKEKPCELAIFGEIFSHTDEASFLFPQRTPEKKARYFRHIFKVFDLVEKGQARYGILPYENTTQGSVFDTLDELFLRENIQIVGAKENTISQNLLGLPGSTISEIKKVFSHPQALAQSQKFLREHCPEAQMFNENSTSTAAKKILELNNPTIAAIGSRMLAKNLELDLLVTDMQQAENRTRFVLIEKVTKNFKPNMEGKFTSFVFWFTGDKSGNLAQVLTLFADRKVNLTKLDSRRASAEYGNYLFYIDAEMGKKDFEKLKPAIVNLCGGLKVLGHF